MPPVKKTFTANNRIEAYGLFASNDSKPERDKRLMIEMEAIRRGGIWKNKSGESCGLGLIHHYRAACRLAWPHIDWHRWTEDCNREIRRPNAKVTVLMGPGSTNKSCVAAWEYLLEYYVFPNECLVLVSSTTLDSLRRRVWGEIKRLHELAKDAFPWLPGVLTDSKNCITTDRIKDVGEGDIRNVRDYNTGLACVPTVQGGRAVGLGRLQGIKQKRLRLIADDATAMAPVVLSIFSNFNNNEDFQAIVSGNPDDILDPLGMASEPVDGWSSHMEPEKTAAWDTKFFSGRCVNLVGTDSPNFDFPGMTKYPYLISDRKIKETISGFGKDSFEYYSQCVGVMKISQLSRRVITRDLCKQFNASEKVVWDGTGTTKVAALDAAYGGDRCVGGHAEFGTCFDGKVRLMFYPQHNVPVKVNRDKPMAEEDSISEYEKDYCIRNDVPPENFFHDSTGRGSLGTSLSRIWSSACNPVEFGGTPSKRPVSMDTFTTDKETGERRLKRCDEHYSKFVTELWYSLRYAIEADQIRGLPLDVIDELCTRNWDSVANDKKEVESKLELKKRIRKSCDLGDWAAIILEGARRLGFQIAKLSPADVPIDDGWQKENEELDHALNEELLIHT